MRQNHAHQMDCYALLRPEIEFSRSYKFPKPGMLAPSSTFTPTSPEPHPTHGVCPTGRQNHILPEPECVGVLPLPPRHRRPHLLLHFQPHIAHHHHRPHSRLELVVSISVCVRSGSSSQEGTRCVPDFPALCFNRVSGPSQ